MEIPLRADYVNRAEDESQTPPQAHRSHIEKTTDMGNQGGAKRKHPKHKQQRNHGDQGHGPVSTVHLDSSYTCKDMVRE